MSSQRRRVAPKLRGRRVPTRSRVTLRRGEAPLGRSATLADALRDSRAALSRLEGELGDLLSALRDPGGRPDTAAPDRLRGATSAADVAMSSLRALSNLARE
jgi:hypothetical protein